ncbi:MAG: U32 family peptidase [Desulfobacteraceae bacterium]|nr:U32 family peptidase [Desulfobacteraceae bacterium]
MTPPRYLPKVELLAPAGSLEKLEIVLHYGADAVYLAGQAFSLRNFASNFSLKEMAQAIALAHSKNAKVYVAVNIFARNEELPAIESYLRNLAALTPDAIIVADPAVLSMVKSAAPGLFIHLSTQANTTNGAAARFWQSQGVRRINAARELSLQEIAAIAHSCDLEVEAFVHGAMCISYSGRCLLSNFMAQRPSNQGMCCQPCRFQYTVMEETRPGQYFPVREDERGTYIFNSRDLCMLEHLPAMIQSGIRSLKIEGRMKSIHYAATAVKIYREAIDRYYESPEQYRLQPYWQEELDKITNRGYCTGFYLGDPSQVVPQYNAPCPSSHTMLAKVLADAGHKRAHIEVRNQIRQGEPIEIVQPNGPPIEDAIRQITTLEGDEVALAQPGSRVILQLNTQCQPLDLIRRRSAG